MGRLNDVSAASSERQCGCWFRSKSLEVSTGWDAAIQAYLREANAEVADKGLRWSCPRKDPLVGESVAQQSIVLKLIIGYFNKEKDIIERYMATAMSDEE